MGVFINSEGMTVDQHSSMIKDWRERINAHLVGGDAGLVDFAPVALGVVKKAGILRESQLRGHTANQFRERMKLIFPLIDGRSFTRKFFNET